MTGRCYATWAWSIEAGIAHGLAPQERLILINLARHADETARCFPSLARLAEAAGYRPDPTNRSARRAVTHLVDLGLVVRERSRPGTTTVYRLVIGPTAISPTPDTYVRGDPPAISPTPDMDVPHPGHGCPHTPDMGVRVKYPSEGSKEGRAPRRRRRVAVAAPEPATDDDWLGLRLGGQLATAFGLPMTGTDR